ncbi:phosphate ABC transporter substrate-binding protein PstS [Mycobacterium spongiae]|uniref:Phosphate-binding protein n=1 Tax=Mycobacterium spongiae TaxID=886343 RepID=A0A975PYB6_9MYCO|nr:phosphate ABC transporter substrate-binding protein PstS [Mycobacterium spongiae]QUR68967.1 phosphate ABC transporter substrate-binding protein PstS [Mycobacterium spongiae]
MGKLTPVAVATIAIVGAVVTACGNGDKRDGASTLAVPGVTVGPAVCGGEDTLSAEGSTAQEAAMGLFNQAWSRLCPGKKVLYKPTGSGIGRKRFIAGHIDFAGSDSPLVSEQIGPAAERCGGNPAWDVPLVFGPIALVYNLTDVPAVTLDADSMAKIFTGLIRAWDDPILAALNPDLDLPKTPITPIYRSDLSGTTDNFQKYLTAAAPQSWDKGVGGEFHGGVGKGAHGSAGVIAAVKANPGAIGYVEKGFADQAGVPYVQLETGNGVVPLTQETATNAVDAVTFAARGNDLVLDLTSVYGLQGPEAYTLVLATYEIVCSGGYDPDTGAAVKGFLATAATEGQADLSKAGYVPLPKKVRERVATAINAMQ